MPPPNDECFVCWLSGEARKPGVRAEVAIAIAFNAGRLSEHTGCAWHACHDHAALLSEALGNLSDQIDGPPPPAVAGDCTCSPALSMVGAHAAGCPVLLELARR